MGKLGLSVIATITIGLVLAVASGVLTSSRAQESAPTLASITTANDYKSVTLTFSEAVYPLDGDGNADTSASLGTGNFSLAGAGGVTIASVTQGASKAVWTVSFSAAVTPHTATISPNGSIGDAGGTALGAFTEPVPFSSANLQALASSLAGQPIIPAGSVALPLVQDWIAQAHTLSELLPGVASIPTATEAALVSYLEGLNGISSVTFTGTQVAIAFDATATAATLDDLAVDAGVIEAGGTRLDISLQGQASIGVALGGELRLSVGSTVTPSLGADGLAVTLTAAGDFDTTGRFGIVDVSATADADIDATIAIDSLDPVEPTVSGSATLNITAVTISGTGLGEFTGDPLVSITWPDLGTLFNSDVDDDGNPISVENVQVSLENIGPLQNFTGLTVDTVIGGMSWFAGWLRQVQTQGLLGTEIPVLNTTAGNLVPLADDFTEPMLALADLALVVGGQSATGNLSAQQLADVCSMSASEFAPIVDSYLAPLNLPAEEEAAVRTHLLGSESEGIPGVLEICGDLLDNLTITGDAIEYTISASAATSLFSESGPTVNLGLGNDLEGISLNAKSGDWTGEASTSFSLTLGIRLGSNADLGIGPDDPQIGSRVYIKSGTIATAGLDINGTGIGMDARLGFLNASIAGSASADPSFTFGLADDGDGKVTLADMATAADNGTLFALLDLAVNGDINANFTLSNDTIFPSARSLIVSGPFAALGNPSGQVFAFHNTVDQSQFAADRINVAHNLGDALNLKSITAAQAIRMIAGIAEQLGAMAGISEMDLSIPFIDVRFQEAVDFARDFADIADRIEERNPQDVSELQTALSAALAEAGLPSNVAVGVTAEELTLSFAVDKTVTRSYPFSFNGGGLNFAPSEAGASISATASISFNPTIGITFDGNSLEERLFIRGTGPQFSLWVDANAFGTVYLGPLSAGITGAVQVGTEDNPATLAVTIGDSPTDNVTVAELRNDLASQIGVTYGGPLSAALNVSTSLGTGSVNVTGDLANLSGLTVTSDLDFDIALDLNTLVYGTVEVSRFVGRLLEQSEVLSADLPLVGDKLAETASFGRDLQTFASTLDAAWQSAESDDSFIAGLESTLNSICPPGNENCVDVVLLPEDPNTTIGNAQGVELRIMLGQSINEQTTIGGGIDFAPVFDLDLSLEPQMQAGYALDLVMGLSIDDGFYIRPGGSMDSDVLQLFAGFQLNDIDSTSTILGIDANITDGSASLGGTLGPDGTAGGFAVSIDDKLSLRDLSNRQRGVDEIIGTRFEGELTASLPLTTALQDIVSLSVPIFLNVQVADGKPQPTLTLGNETKPIQLDVSSLVDMVRPVLETLNGFDPANGKYNPLAQEDLRSALDTQIPVLNQSVSDTIGELATQFGYANEWAAIDFLLNIGELEIPEDAGQLNLGWVAVLPEFEHHAPEGGLEGQAAFEAISNLIDALTPSSLKSSNTQVANAQTTGIGQIVRIPMLEDPFSAIQLLLGGDVSEPVTFIEIAPPELQVGPKINFQKTLFDLDIAFIKGSLKVGFDGFIGFKVKAGFGYDSTGIATGKPEQGIYLIDYPGNELGLEGRLSGSIDGKFALSAGFDIAAAHFSGAAGVRAQAGIDIFDESIAIPAETRNDGKLHLSEMQAIADSYHPPIAAVPASSALCVFRVGVLLDAYLRLSGSAKVLGITVFSESYSNSWTLVDETLSCSIMQRAGHIKERTLYLNGGTYADRRFDNTGDLEEHFTVSRSGDTVTVTVTTHPLGGGAAINTITTSFSAADFDTIYGELGEGNDRVDIQSGVGFPATLYGGPGDDDLSGGDGDDQIRGDDGNDTLRGGAGINDLRGGNGDDTLWAGPGTDDLLGGGGTNTYMVPEGWGTAVIEDAPATATIDFQTTSGLTGSAAFYDGTVTAGDSLLTYDVSQVAVILGGSGADQFTINRYAPDGFRIDARGGSDHVIVPFSGVDRTITVVDSDNDALLDLRGTRSNDTILFRADGPPVPATGPAPAATQGFVALLGPGTAVDRVNYDNSISKLEVDGTAGNNHFVLDDIAAPLELDSGNGDNSFQVGQIFGTPRVPDNVAAGDEVRTRGVEGRGDMSLGVSHPATLRGGDGEDHFTVYSNVATLKLEGAGGDDVFTLRAFILEGSVEAAGGDGHDKFEYVRNEDISIDGGTGFNTMVIVGTELSDGYVIDADTVQVCPQYAAAEVPAWSPVDRLPNPDSDGCALNVAFTNIQEIVFHGLEGNDAFWVRSTSPDFHIRLFGGQDGDTFLVGDQGNLTAIDGPIELDGLADPAFDASIADPVVLPGEDDTPAGPGLTGIVYDDQDDRVVVDGSAHTTDDTGTLNASRIFGLGMGDDVTINGNTYPGGVTYTTFNFVTVLLGSGNDQFTVETTHTYIDGDDLIRATTLVDAGAGNDLVDVKHTMGATTIAANTGDDEVLVRTIEGDTNVDLSAGGDNVVRVGNKVEAGATHPDGASILAGIRATLHVIGGDDSDRLVLEASGTVIDEDNLGERVDIEQGRITQLSMPGEVTHTASIDVLDIYLTGGEDVANVRGTSAGATNVYGLDRNDRTFVSDAASIGTGAATPAFLPGTLDDIDGNLNVLAGSGDNLLMASHRDGGAITGATLDENSLTGFATGTITYGTDEAGTFAGGITVWTGAEADNISVAGARLDGDPTTLDWHERAEGGARTITTLNTLGGDDSVSVAVEAGTHGFFALNTGDGADTVDGTASTLGFVVFGGPGNDNITTGSGDDIAFGDEGRVEYCAPGGATVDSRGAVTACGTILTSLGNENVANINDGVARAPARMYSLATDAGDTDGVEYQGWTAGFNNRVNVGAGDNVAWGGLGSDLLRAESGTNALLSDHGEIWRFHPSELGGQKTIASKNPFINVQVLTGEIAYVVKVDDAPGGGNDVVIGGTEADWIFAGSGQDIVNGNDGGDIIWGGYDADIIWGGVGDDRIYGGEGDNIIDIKKSSYDMGLTTGVTDTNWWALALAVAPTADIDSDAATVNGSDIVYGGRGQDIMQADMGAGGPVPGDRLIDWTGSFNLYLVCDGGYGAGRIQRNGNPDMIEVLLGLGEADGGYDVRIKNSSGWNQLALAVDEFAGENRGGTHPNHPGNKAGC